MKERYKLLETHQNMAATPLMLYHTTFISCCIYAKFFASMLYNSTYLFFTCWAHFWLQNFPSGTNSSTVP